MTEDVREYFKQFIDLANNHLHELVIPRGDLDDDTIWTHISRTLDYVNAAYDIIWHDRRNQGLP
jgi:hypothetical protein